MTTFKAKPQFVYLDKKSYEAGTGRAKAKYKLAGYQFPVSGTGHPQLFWVLTSQPGRYPARTTIVCEQSHWVKTDTKSLVEPISYISHTHSEMITRAELLMKRRDRANRFLEKAKLADSKFEELKQLIKNERIGPRRTIEELRVIATSTTNTQTDAEGILKELHLL